jgi:hypothetical protein
MYNFRISIGSLVLACGLTGFATSQPAAQNGKNPASNPSDQREEFDLHLMAGEKAEDGTMLQSRIYEGSYGHRVTVVHGEFSSYEAAKAHLRYQMKQAEHVFDFHPRTNVELGPGERAVVLFPMTGSIPKCAAVLLTEGPHYYEIVSESLDVVLDVEQRANNKRFKPQK